jgi:hypothetical protein
VNEASGASTWSSKGPTWAIIAIAAGQLRRDDPARFGIHPDVHLAPGPAPSRAVLLD